MAVDLGLSLWNRYQGGLLLGAQYFQMDGFARTTQLQGAASSPEGDEHAVIELALRDLRAIAK
jgi:hypothetical protein